jgi:excinuclease UvrABC ATPase subunit
MMKIPFTHRITLSISVRKPVVHGGEVVVSGYLDELLTAPKNKSGSVTLAYLRGEKEIPVPVRRTGDMGAIASKGGMCLISKI